MIVDLEDGVAPARKDEARANLSDVGVHLHHSGGDGDVHLHHLERAVFVRVNAGNTADLELVARLPLSGVLVPKVERPEDVPDLPHPVHCLIETPLGLENAFAIASDPRVAGVSLGEADLRSQTGALEAGLDWARGRIVNAAVAAGLPRPPQSVYANVRDLDGLAASCRRGRELGHLGRAAIHPDQLPVIEAAYLPTDEEVARARATIARLEEGVGTIGGGEFVDPAMLGAAQQVVAIAERYG